MITLHYTIYRFTYQVKIPIIFIKLINDYLQKPLESIVFNFIEIESITFQFSRWGNEEIS